MDDLELQLKTIFLQEEAGPLISEAEHFFLSLEIHPEDQKILEQLFRIAHNIKGSSKAAGFAGLSEFTHQLESLLSKLKKGEIQVETGVVNLLLRCNDHLQLMVESLKTKMDAQTDSSQILHEIGRFMSGEAQAQLATMTPAIEAIVESIPEPAESVETQITPEVSNMKPFTTPPPPPVHSTPQPVETVKSIEKYLEFSLGAQSYAVPLEAVLEVIALPEITSVPYT
ncbi:Hpt domain-containing protein, partial [Bdellovibrionota bacterium FG-2]